MSAKVTLWKSKFLLDVEVIDNQHKRFFEICQEIDVLCASPGDMAVRDIIVRIFQLRSYAFHHFHTEEELTVKYAYPKMFLHFREHDKYLKALQDFGAELETVCEGKAECHEHEGLRELAKKISEYVVDWWAKHILTWDKKATDHFKKKKRACPV